MKKIYLCLLAGLIFQLLNSQTTISSNIFSNTTWNAAGSPYIVTTDIIVFEGVTLTVTPGVTIKVDNGKQIEVRGKLNAIGVLGDSITFTSSAASPTMGIWKGIRFVGVSDPLHVGDQARFEYCKGMYADKFVDLDIAYHGPYIFKNCLFYKNNIVNEDGGSPRTDFDYCTFLQNQTGLGYVQFGGTARHCSFLNNVNGVAGFETVDTCYFEGNTGVAHAPYGVTTGCTIINNNIGVQAWFNAVNHTFINNYVCNNNIGVEMNTYFNGSINFFGNTLCNNTTYNLKHLHMNNADIANNCWCSKDSVYIRSTIYDGYSPGSSSGLVDFMPVATSCPQFLGVSPAGNIDRFVFYPNPFTETVNIVFPEDTEMDESFSLEVFNTFGQSVRIEKNRMDEKTIQLSIPDHPKGIYFVSITSGGEKRVVKLLAN